MSCSLLLEELSVSEVWNEVWAPLGEQPWKLGPRFPQTSPPCTFPFADFSSHLFVEMKLSFGYVGSYESTNLEWS